MVVSSRMLSVASLNPCFNGRYSQRWVTGKQYYEYPVLILVLMEDTLRAREETLPSVKSSFES